MFLKLWRQRQGQFCVRDERHAGEHRGHTRQNSPEGWARQKTWHNRGLRTCLRSYCAPVSLCRAVLGILTYYVYAPVPALRPPWLTGARYRSCTGSHKMREKNRAPCIIACRQAGAPLNSVNLTAIARLKSVSSIAATSAAKAVSQVSTISSKFSLNERLSRFALPIAAA